MPDYRTMYDSEYLYAFHLGGREVTLKIARVTGGELTGEGGKKTKKPIVYFEGKQLGLGLNKTNGKTISALYGTNTEKWVGKLVTIYPTTTTFGRNEVECIRVRPQIPNGRGQAPRQQPSSEQVNPPEQAPEPYDGPPDDEPLEPGSDG